MHVLSPIIEVCSLLISVECNIQHQPCRPFQFQREREEIDEWCCLIGPPDFVLIRLLSATLSIQQMQYDAAESPKTSANSYLLQYT